MQARAFNPQVFLELLCYLVFGGLMVYLVASGRYLFYVTPRMEPYLVFTAVIMLIWAFSTLGRLFRPQHKIRSAHCFVLAIPVLLLLLPHTPLSIDSFSAKYIGRSAIAGLSGGQSAGSTSGVQADTGTDFSAAIPEEALTAADPVSEWDSAAPETAYSRELPGLNAENREISVANDYFGLWLNEIYMDMDKYKSHKITMTGFVFKDPEFMKENEFSVSRLVMSCCAADLAPAGLICIYDGPDELKAGSWITVEGTLEIGKTVYDGTEFDDPKIILTKITPAQEVEGYVYLY